MMIEKNEFANHIDIMKERYASNRLYNESLNPTIFYRNETLTKVVDNKETKVK